MVSNSIQAKWSKPARLFAGATAAVAGGALFATPLSPQQLSVVTGIGLALVGAMLAMSGGEDRRSVWLSRLSGGAIAALGMLTILWPDAGAPWLARLIAFGMMLHSLASGLAAVRGDRDRRVAGVLISLAGLALGVLSLSWPVLTLSLFRLIVGAWLVFTGLRILLEALRRRTAKPREGAHSTFMHWARTFAAAAALVLAVGAAYGSMQLLNGTPLPVPGAFYAAPTEVPDRPGRLIRSEPLTTGVPAGARAWRILYTTTRPDGSPAISSGTILAPAGIRDAPMPLLSVAHGTTGVVDGCSPSLSATPFADGAGTAMAEMVVEHGWVAVTSDYIGMGTQGMTPYLVGEAEARNVLDASRAAQQFDELTVTSETVVWGHSQGGQGSLWTGQIAEAYAPELAVRGVAAFAPAADLFGLAEAAKANAGGKTVSSYIAYTWDEVFPELELSKHLTPGSAEPVARIAALCFNGSDAMAAILRGTQVPNQVFPDSVLSGEFGALLKQQTPTGPWPAPVLVAQGLSDPLVLPSLQQQWVRDRCEAGEAIDFRTFEGLGHVDLVAADSPLTPQIVEWTLERWNGEPAPTTCTSREYIGKSG